MRYWRSDGTWSSDLSEAQSFSKADEALQECMQRQIAEFQIVIAGNPSRLVIQLEKTPRRSKLTSDGRAYYFRTSEIGTHAEQDEDSDIL